MPQRVKQNRLVLREGEAREDKPVIVLHIYPSKFLNNILAPINLNISYVYRDPSNY